MATTTPAPGRAACRSPISSRFGGRSAAPAGRCEMAAIAEYTPPWVGAILGWRATWFLARLALSSAYVIGGGEHAAHFPVAVARQAPFRLRAPAARARLTLSVDH